MCYPLITSSLTESTELGKPALWRFESRELAEISEIENLKGTEANPNCEAMQLIDTESEKNASFRRAEQ